MKYTEAVEYLLGIPKFSKGKTSQEDLKVYLAVLDNPQDGLKVIHVAGTNGKGSVCAYLTSCLIEAGYHVGTFTSPHLIRINERFAIDRKPVEDDIFTAAFQTVKETADRLIRQGYQHPTYFEFLFLMCMVMFRDAKVDYAVLETGLGGRLDATNVIDHPLICIITSISLDHVKILGDTILQIAGEKAGIIKSGIPVVYDSTNREAGSVMAGQAKRKGSPAYPVGGSSYSISSIDKHGICFCGADEAFGREEYSIPFIGEYQVENAMLAVTALGILSKTAHRINMEAVKKGLAGTVWPGRMEQALPGVYLDGAHNEGGMREFVKTANRVAGLGDGSGKVYVLFGVVADKDYETMVRELCSQVNFDAAVLAHIDNTRALDVERMRGVFEACTDKPVYAFQTVEEAVDKVISMKTEEDTVFCVGSLYLIGSIKEVIGRKIP